MDDVTIEGTTAIVKDVCAFNLETVAWICDQFEIEHAVMLVIDVDEEVTGEIEDPHYGSFKDAFATAAHSFEDGEHRIWLHPSVADTLHSNELVREFTHAIIHELTHASQSEHFANWESAYLSDAELFEQHADETADNFIEEVLRRKILLTKEESNA